METVQPSSYTRSSAIAGAILLVLLWGFHRTYTVFFPVFEGFLFVQHFHGFVMLLWMCMLVVQPLFIAKKRYRFHRLTGNASFLLAPLLMLSIFLVSQMVYYRTLSSGTSADAYGVMALSLPGIPIFAILYGLAILNRRRTYYHMRYMIGTGIMMLGPGIGRILGIWFGVPEPLIITSTLIIVAVVALAFLVTDIIRKSDVKPYAIVAALMITQSLIWEARYTSAWQGIGKWFATVAF